jgi:hypothetical protein
VGIFEWFTLPDIPKIRKPSQEHRVVSLFIEYLAFDRTFARKTRGPQAEKDAKRRVTA